jgi:hypothetical protein
VDDVGYPTIMGIRSGEWDRATTNILWTKSDATFHD